MSKKTYFQETLAGLESHLQELIKDKTAPYAENTFEFLCKFMDPTNAAILASLNPHSSAFLGEDMLVFPEQLANSSLSPEELFFKHVRSNLNLIIFTTQEEQTNTVLALQDLGKFVAQIKQKRDEELELLLNEAQVPDQPGASPNYLSLA
ncbi:MAG: hypothetical protein PHU71_00445 [Candidatus Gracilibacteria bacterium]|nr:hypothetical protein [Candidatus Gracilibacteria bacterium]